ncbi:MAG TPA: 3-hydroxyacyl-CoA dehydrogenase family protein, partial [Chitinophagaceae bacterium]|nr:3-hydroxyacyl-CoA dehydrogenase family protein [Chitinophagaceae bacterium]
KISTKLIDLFKDGYKGRKNKKGFYRYDQKGKKVKGTVNLEVYNYYGGQKRMRHAAEEIQMRAAMAMVNEAALCLQEGIITSPLDGDIGAVFGLGFPPFLGGPFRYMDTLGAAEVVRIMNELAAKHGARFKPAQIILDHAKENKTFY